MRTSALTLHRHQPSALRLCASALGLACLALLGAFSARAADDKKPLAATKPALTVTLTEAASQTWPIRISANGSLAPWQEAIVGSEAHGLRLAEVRAQVGDTVKRGQVLAVFSDDTVQADLAQARAAVAEAEALLAEATANAQRARDLAPSGVMSTQQTLQYLTAERTAQARLQSAKAAEQQHRLRLKHTQVVAPDAGVVSARSATVGAVTPAGQELFRLIRQGRLEWRAELGAADLAQIKPGMNAVVTPTGSAPLRGTVRQVAPALDNQTRNGLVYVDLNAGLESGARAGVFARGEFDLSQRSALTLPQSAVQQRDGFHYVMRVDDKQRVLQTKVSVGRRSGDRVEVVSGLTPQTKVVASGGAFLADGDTVRVVAASDLPAKLAPPAAGIPSGTQLHTPAAGASKP
jgi:HlyD family secretion protein